MTQSDSEALATIDKILNGEFPVTDDGHELVASQQAALKAAGIDSKVGTLAYAGTCKDGTFAVQFNSAGRLYASRWPEWAYQSATHALHHGKQAWAIYKGEGPFGHLLLQVLVLAWKA